MTGDNLPAVRVETSHDLVNPTTDSWTVALAPVVELARSICGTDFVPDSLRDNVAGTTAAIMYGRELGLPPMTALGSTHMIKGRVGVSAEILRALVLEQGHEIVVRESSGGQVVMAGRRKGTTDWTVVTWTLDDARRAKLSGDNWTKYPRQMLAARASAELCRLIFADVIHGMAATEELEGIDSPSMAGPAAPGDGSTKVQRKTRTSKTDDGAASGAANPTAGAGAPAASSSPVPPLPGEPGFDGPDVGVAAAAQSADGEPRVPATPASTPPLSPEQEAEERDVRERMDQEGEVEQEDITDPQRKKLFALMAEHGLKEKDKQIGWISKNLNREITSRAQVNKDDAKQLIDILEQLDATPRPISRGDLRLLGGLFDSLGITVVAERIHIASSIVGRTPMKEGQPSSEGLTAAEGKTLMEALGRCKTRDHVEALVQLAEQQRAEGGEQA